MDIDFDSYIRKVKGLLSCNTTKEYNDNNLPYTHSNKDIDTNLEYFRECLKDGLSPYKALLYFEP
jgi:hypothetical protein